MFTAKDVSKIIEEHDPRIDTFIEEVLLPKFIDNGRTISLPTEAIALQFNYEITRNRFMDQMRKRGFFIEEKCDDRPAGSCWYQIQVPPQEE